MHIYEFKVSVASFDDAMTDLPDWAEQIKLAVRDTIDGNPDDGDGPMNATIQVVPLVQEQPRGKGKK